MDLADYLAASKNKRQDLIRAADHYFQRTQSVNTEDSNKIHSSELYSGPTPKGLRDFEYQVGSNLKKFFNPHLNDKINATQPIYSGRLSNSTRIPYLNNQKSKRRKQLVIVPKNFYETLRFPLSRHRKLGELELNEVYTVQDVKPKLKTQKKVGKGLLMLPILSTLDSHEAREKIYKYK